MRTIQLIFNSKLNSACNLENLRKCVLPMAEMFHKIE